MKQSNTQSKIKQLYKDVEWFLMKRGYIIPLLLTGFLAYGFSIVQPDISNDDTAIPYYFVDGQSVRMGRWTLFLLNKFFHFAEYAPYFLEAIGVILLMLAITLFCVLLKRITGEADCVGYTIFACVFLSCPSICEVNYYYAHNGVDFGFCCIALALLVFDDMICYKVKMKDILIQTVVGLAFLSLAIGCCESLIMVYAMGAMMICYLRKQKSEEFSWKKILIAGGAVVVICLLSILLREPIKELIVLGFSLQDTGEANNWRSPGESALRIFQAEGLAELKMLVKRFWLVYHVNAFVYLPVLAYAGACLVVGCHSIALMIKKRSLWFPMLWLGMYLAPYALVVAEWKVPAYRAAQFLPVFAGFGAFVCYRAAAGKWERYWRKAVAVLAFVLVFNQAEYMNRCFYIEYIAYQNNCAVINGVAADLQRGYDTDLPVVFRGQNETPQVLVDHYVAPFDSKGYKMVAFWADLVDDKLKEKYFVDSGYNYGGEIDSDFLTYGYAAFDNNSEQIVIFMNNLGYTFKTLKDEELLKEADVQWQDMPAWPEVGSIQQYDDYILVRVGNR